MVLLRDVGACIDRHEAVVVRGRAEPATDRPPSTEISWNDAERACRASGFRLCTEAEWSRACEGRERRMYPYGNEHQPGVCNVLEDGADGHQQRIQPSGSFPRCASPEGVLDLAGNVGEWTDETDDSGLLRELRGGAAFNHPQFVRCRVNDRGFQPTDIAYEGMGFRCCGDPH